MNLSLSQSATLTIPPFLNQQVKVEESTSVKLPPSTIYLDESYKKFLQHALILDHFLKNDPQPAKMDPLTVPWYQLISKPIVLPKNPPSLENLFLSEKKYLNKEQNPCAEQKLEADCKCEAETTNSFQIIKKEEEEPAKEITTQPKKKRKSRTDDTPKKKAQNRIKNFPGLVVQRVKSSLKLYLSLKHNRLERLEERFKYLVAPVNSLTPAEKKVFLNFLDKYQKRWKTWNTIQNFLNENTRFGRLLLNTVLEFFEEDGREDFEDWLSGGKMGEKSKETAIKMKEHIAKKFSLIVLKGEEEEQQIKAEKKLFIEKKEICKEENSSI